MYGIFRTAAGTWHVVKVPDNVVLVTFATTVEEAVVQLDELEAKEN